MVPSRLEYLPPHCGAIFAVAQKGIPQRRAKVVDDHRALEVSYCNVYDPLCKNAAAVRKEEKIYQ